MSKNIEALRKVAEIEKRLKELNITFDKDTKLIKHDGTISYCIPDSWTGTNITYSIDKFNHLLCTINDDSPQQAAGFIQEYIYVGKDKIDISRMTDKFAYIVHDQDVYMCEVDKSIISGVTLQLIRKNSKQETFFPVEYITLEEFKKLTTESIEEYIRGRINRELSN